MQFTRSYGLNYAATISGPQVNSADTVAAAYNGASEGVIDVPSGAATGTVFNVPLGSVQVPKCVFLQNAGLSGTVEVAVNGATGSFIELSAGGSIDIAMPLPAAGKPVLEIVAVVGATQPGEGQLRYIVLGD